MFIICSYHDSTELSSTYGAPGSKGISLSEHRIAVLESMSIEKNDVSSVSAVVIAGRDGEYNSAHLRRLKGTDFGKIKFLTFDDLLYSLDSLIQNLH